MHLHPVFFKIGNPSPSAVGTKKRKASVTKRSTAKRSKKVTDEEDGEDGEDGEEEEDEEESSEDNEDDDDQVSPFSCLAF